MIVVWCSADLVRLVSPRTKVKSSPILQRIPAGLLCRKQVGVIAASLHPSLGIENFQLYAMEVIGAIQLAT